MPLVMGLQCSWEKLIWCNRVQRLLDIFGARFVWGQNMSSLALSWSKPARQLQCAPLPWEMGWKFFSASWKIFRLFSSQICERQTQMWFTKWIVAFNASLIRYITFVIINILRRGCPFCIITNQPNWPAVDKGKSYKCLRIGFVTRGKKQGIHIRSQWGQ